MTPLLPIITIALGLFNFKLRLPRRSCFGKQHGNSFLDATFSWCEDDFVRNYETVEKCAVLTNESSALMNGVHNPASRLKRRQELSLPLFSARGSILDRKDLAVIATQLAALHKTREGMGCSVGRS